MISYISCCAQTISQFLNSIYQMISTSDAIEILAIFIGAWIVIWQANRQHRDNLKVQKENLKTDLKIKLHTDIEKCIDNLSQAELNASSFCRKLNYSFISAEAQGNQSHIKETALDFLQKDGYVHVEIANLIKIFEKYEIVCPELDVFQLAFNSAAHDLRGHFSPYFSELLNFLPFKTPEEKIPLFGPLQYQKIPTKEQQIKLQNLSDNYIESLSYLGCYIMDLRKEIQNLLLSETFQRKLNPRNPIDPKYFAITTEEKTRKKIIDYFKNETPWGKNIKEINNNVKEDLKKN